MIIVKCAACDGRVLGSDGQKDIDDHQKIYPSHKSFIQMGKCDECGSEGPIAQNMKYCQPCSKLNDKINEKTKHEMDNRRETIEKAERAAALGIQYVKNS